jgi:hypothetical protein
VIEVDTEASGMTRALACSSSLRVAGICLVCSEIEPLLALNDLLSIGIESAHDYQGMSVETGIETKGNSVRGGGVVHR